MSNNLTVIAYEILYKSHFILLTVNVPKEIIISLAVQVMRYLDFIFSLPKLHTEYEGQQDGAS